MATWGVQVEWGRVPGGSGYRLFRREEPSGPWLQVVETGGTRFEDHGPEPGRMYAYRVEAFNADVEGHPSSPRSIAVTGVVVREQHAPPEELEVETAVVRQGDQAVREVRLIWRPPSAWNCRGYAIFRGLTGSNAFEPVGASASTSFVDRKPANAETATPTSFAASTPNSGSPKHPLR